MKAILFDVDDTIYDQQVVFDQTCREVFGELKDVSLVDLFKANRYYSDESFEAMGRGEMTKEEMYIYRIKRAMEDFHLPITDEQAVRYQKRYVYYGTQIMVSDQMREILEYCGKHMKLGIITNGPSAHQWRKIKTLDLERWIRPEYIFVSGDVGVHKPERGIFEYAMKKMNLQNPEDIVYVGDSYEKDILGAAGAGWRTIWLERRERELPEDIPEHTLIARSEEDLFKLIREMS